MEGPNSDNDNGENYDGIRSWVTDAERTEKVVTAINVKGECECERAVEIRNRGKELPRGILRELNIDKDKNSDVDQDCLDIEQFEIIKTVGKGE